MSADPDKLPPVKLRRCAIYARKSTEEGLEQEFNSLDAQREAAQAFIASQKHEGWTLVPTRYEDGGFSGAHLDRPALQKLLHDIRLGRIHCVVVYKVDRLTRSLLDFSRIMDVLDQHQVTFVLVTQQFNTTSSLGRLTLNILLSFAQFEREMISERTRDKMSAARRKGKWVGGNLILGYDLKPEARGLAVNALEAQQIREIFGLYQEHGSLLPVVHELHRREWRMKSWINREGKPKGGEQFTRNALHVLLTNPVYAGQVRHRGKLYPGEQEAILEAAVWDEVQHRLARHGKNGARDADRFAALLGNLVRCGTCGTAMTHTTVRKNLTVYRYYTCIRTRNQGVNACRTRSVSAPVLEEAVVENLRQLAQAEDHADSPLGALLAWDDLTLPQRNRAIRQVIERVLFDGPAKKVQLALRTPNQNVE